MGLEKVELLFDDGTGREFDKRVRGKGVLRDGGDLTVVTKNGGTIEGRPVVLLTFTVELPDGTLAKAQTVTTARMIQSIAEAIIGKYGVL